ncbi:helix-turn-helix domain-containing protein [Deinococcus sp.]|uniref:helix-turn-helix domain-containing protein n=1 Tax=Deinococcus sp. TaxID=47478 RepID=UPI003C7B97DF
MTLHHVPNTVEQSVARSAQQLLTRTDIQLSSGESSLTLTPELTTLLRDILTMIGNGESIMVLSHDEELSTQQAADLLRVSRPYLIEKLLDAQLLPHRKVGKHRRIRLSDLLAYQRQDQELKRALAREFTELNQEIDPY